MAKSFKRSYPNTKKFLVSLWRDGLRKSSPARQVALFLKQKKSLPKAIRVVAIGKSAYPMASAASKVLKTKIVDGLMIVPKASYVRPLPQFKILTSSHPIPSERSLQCGKELQSFVSPKNRVMTLFLISGGASSLAVLPKPGMPFREKQRRIKILLKSGASIQKLNRFRIAHSAIKGGKILKDIRSPVLSLIVSDIVGDPLGLIASGLTVSKEHRSNIKNILLAPCSSFATSIVQIAKQKKIKTLFLKKPFTGDARTSGIKFGNHLRNIKGPCLVVGYGETTVRVTGDGKGGRNHEFALGAARSIQHSSISVLSLASDGVDGTSKGAGAFVNGTTLDKIRRKKLDLKKIQAESNTDFLFRQLKDQIVTGPTGVNFADIQLAWIDAK